MWRIAPWREGSQVLSRKVGAGRTSGAGRLLMASKCVSGGTG